MADFDVIVVGSGMTGGYAAKELTEQGFRVLVIERGRRLEHGTDYKDELTPWTFDHFGRVPEAEMAEDYPIQSTLYAFNSGNKDFWVKDTEFPYSTPEGQEFRWHRGNHLGGRSLMWGRQSYRLSEMDFEANARDGHGVDWPVRYADIAPWYDRVERFIGISGTNEGVASLPDGQFQPGMDLTAVEKDFKQKLERRYSTRKMFIGRVANLTEPTEEQIEGGRGQCQSRNMCFNGCSFGAYFSSLSSTLPAAERTGNLTVITDAIVDSVTYDPQTRRVTGVRVIDSNTMSTSEHSAKVVFLCASTIPTTQILLNSTSEAFPTGLANRSDQVGRNLMDHIGLSVVGMVPGFEDRYYWGRRPNGGYIPRYRNATEAADGYVRGYGYQIGTMRRSKWSGASGQAGIGAEFKESLRDPAGWMFMMHGFGEMLPNPENRVTLHPTRKDKWNQAIAHIDCKFGDNENRILDAIEADAREMINMAGYFAVPMPARRNVPGEKIHEMGTARMGRDPATSVVNAHNHAHDIDNLYITDGSFMASSGCQNPSLTYMAFTARAAHHAGDRLRSGAL